MIIPRKLACKEGLVYVPKRAPRTCCQNRYEPPYMHRSDNLEGDGYTCGFDNINIINCLIISYFCAVLFPFDLVTNNNNNNNSGIIL